MIQNVTAETHWQRDEGVTVLAVDEPVFAALAAAVQVAFDGQAGDDFPAEFEQAADELWQFFVPEREQVA